MTCLGRLVHVQGQGLVLQQRQHRNQAVCASLRIIAQTATMEAPSRTTGKGPSEAAPELGTQKPTVSASSSPSVLQYGSVACHTIWLLHVQWQLDILDWPTFPMLSFYLQALLMTLAVGSKEWDSTGVSSPQPLICTHALAEQGCQLSQAPYQKPLSACVLAGQVIITGASSGLGLAAAKALGATGDWHVVMACRDFSKAARAALAQGIPKENYSIMHLDLAAFDSVRQFVKVRVHASGWHRL